jgi:plasmid rolling circle replication initiator protein Rep
MPDQISVGRKFDKPIVTSSLSDEYTFLESLSEKDKPWDKHRKNADIVSDYYKQGGMDSHAERVSLCSQLLEFKLVPDKKTGQQRLKLASAKFCRVRHCPICQ